MAGQVQTFLASGSENQALSVSPESTCNAGLCRNPLVEISTKSNIGQSCHLRALFLARLFLVLFQLPFSRLLRHPKNIFQFIFKTEWQPQALRSQSRCSRRPRAISVTAVKRTGSRRKSPQLHSRPLQTSPKTISSK